VQVHVDGGAMTAVWLAAGVKIALIVAFAIALVGAKHLRPAGEVRLHARERARRASRRALARRSEGT
jgi:hypothetical protein